MESDEVSSMWEEIGCLVIGLIVVGIIIGAVIGGVTVWLIMR